MTEESVETKKGDDSFIRGMTTGTLYIAAYNTLALIESYAERSIEMPNSITLSKEKRLPFT
ncbi:hypothetical protein FEI13_12110 [Halomonas urmiana]|uniref:Uncharacterized protein n=1 Tax=Halomonas urmiana TaxID=490901 RepID=A0A5R8MFN0_9GAMM|nr:hypothetical protein [Halomonas urmiana]TLF49181.1 hypothetical protein FEI13_12110 [Halomonas urmiana]